MIKKDEFRMFAYHAVCDNWYGRQLARIMLPESLATPDSIRRYKEAGFNTLFISYVFQFNAIDEDFETSKLKKVMDMAYAEGLECFVFETNLHRLTGRRHSLIDAENADGENIFATEEELEKYVARCLKPLMSHPAFIGVSTRDEPYKSMFTAYGQAYRAMKKIKPDLYINANIDLGFWEPNPEEETEEEKRLGPIEKFKSNLEKWYGTVTPDFLQYDSYPIRYRTKNKEFLNGRSITPTVLAAYCLAGEFSRERDWPLGVVMQACEFKVPTAGWGCCRTTESDMYWQNNLAMAVGTRTFSYWSYFPVVNSAGEYYDDSASIVDTFGRPNELYRVLQKMHEEMQKTAKVLTRFKYDGVKLYTTERIPGDGEFIRVLEETLENGVISSWKASKISGVELLEDGALFISEMKDYETGEVGYYIVNATDPTAKTSQTAIISFGNAKSLRIYDKGEMRVEALQDGRIDLRFQTGAGIFVIPQ